MSDPTQPGRAALDAARAINKAQSELNRLKLRYNPFEAMDRFDTLSEPKKKQAQDFGGGRSAQDAFRSVRRTQKKAGQRALVTGFRSGNYDVLDDAIKQNTIGAQVRAGQAGQLGLFSAEQQEQVDALRKAAAARGRAWAARTREKVRERNALIRQGVALEDLPEIDENLPEITDILLSNVAGATGKSIPEEYLLHPEWYGLKKELDKPTPGNRSMMRRPEMHTRTGNVADPLPDLVVENQPSAASRIFGSATRTARDTAGSIAGAALSVLDGFERVGRNSAAPVLGVEQDKAADPEAFRLAALAKARAQKAEVQRGERLMMTPGLRSTLEEDAFLGRGVDALANLGAAAINQGAVASGVKPAGGGPTSFSEAVTRAATARPEDSIGHAIAFGIRHDPSFVLGSTRNAAAKFVGPLARSMVRHGVEARQAQAIANRVWNNADLQQMWGTRSGRTLARDRITEELAQMPAGQEVAARVLGDFGDDLEYLGQGQIGLAIPGVNQALGAIDRLMPNRSVGGAGRPLTVESRMEPITLSDISGGRVPDYAGRDLMRGAARAAGRAVSGVGRLAGEGTRAGDRLQNWGRQIAESSPVRVARDRNEMYARQLQGRAFNENARAAGLRESEDYARHVGEHQIDRATRQSDTRTNIDPEAVMVDIGDLDPRTVQGIFPGWEPGKGQPTPVVALRAAERSSVDEPRAIQPIPTLPGPRQEAVDRFSALMERVDAGNRSAGVDVGSAANVVTGRYFPRRRGNDPFLSQDNLPSAKQGGGMASRVDATAPILRAEVTDEGLRATPYVQDGTRQQVRVPGMGRPAAEPREPGKEVLTDPIEVLAPEVSSAARRQAQARTREAAFREWGEAPRVSPETGDTLGPRPGYSRVRLRTRLEDDAEAMAGVPDAARPAAEALRRSVPRFEAIGSDDLSNLEAEITALAQTAGRAARDLGRAEAAGNADAVAAHTAKLSATRAKQTQLELRKSEIQRSLDPDDAALARQREDAPAGQVQRVYDLNRKIKAQETLLEKHNDPASLAEHSRKLRELEAQRGTLRSQLDLDQRAAATIAERQRQLQQIDVPNWVVRMADQPFDLGRDSLEGLVRAAVGNEVQTGWGRAVTGFARGVDWIGKRFKQVVLSGNPSYHLLNVGSDTAVMSSVGMSPQAITAELNRAARPRTKQDFEWAAEANAHGIGPSRPAGKGREARYQQAQTQTLDLPQPDRAADRDFSRLETPQAPGRAATRRLRRLARGPEDPGARALDALEGVDRATMLGGDRFGQYWEDVSKLAMFRWARQQGMPAPEAAKFTFDNLVDYGRRQPLVENAVTKMVLPFQRWFTASPGATARIVLRNPARVAAQKAAIQGGLGGQSREEAPPWQERTTWTMPAGPLPRAFFSAARQGLGGTDLEEGEELNVQPRWFGTEAFQSGVTPQNIPSQMNPVFAKPAFEAYTGRNVVTDGPIDYRNSALLPKGTPGVPEWANAGASTDQNWLGRWAAPLLFPRSVLEAGNWAVNQMRGPNDLPGRTFGESRQAPVVAPADRTAGSIINTFIPGRMYSDLPFRGLRNLERSPEMRRLQTLTRDDRQEQMDKLESEIYRRIQQGEPGIPPGLLPPPIEGRAPPQVGQAEQDEAFMRAVNGL